MKLYLVQHGLAVKKDVDPGRPLDPQGEQEVQRIADFFMKSGARVHRVLHSGKIRAHQTAEILAEAVLHNGEVEAIIGINPEDSVQKFSTIVQKLKYDTMIVGHLPFMAHMVSYLICGKEDLSIVAYSPGTVVCLQQDPGQHWQIQWMLRPDTL